MAFAQTCLNRNTKWWNTNLPGGISTWVVSRRWYRLKGRTVFSDSFLPRSHSAFVTFCRWRFMLAALVPTGVPFHLSVFHSYGMLRCVLFHCYVQIHMHTGCSLMNLCSLCAKNVFKRLARVVGKLQGDAAAQPQRQLRIGMMRILISLINHQLTRVHSWHFMTRFWMPSLQISNLKQ